MTGSSAAPRPARPVELAKRDDLDRAPDEQDAPRAARRHAHAVERAAAGDKRAEGCTYQTYARRGSDVVRADDPRVILEEDPGRPGVRAGSSRGRRHGRRRGGTVQRHEDLDRHHHRRRRPGGCARRAHRPRRHRALGAGRLRGRRPRHAAADAGCAPASAAASPAGGSASTSRSTRPSRGGSRSRPRPGRVRRRLRPRGRGRRHRGPRVRRRALRQGITGRLLAEATDALLSAGALTQASRASPRGGLPV